MNINKSIKGKNKKMSADIIIAKAIEIYNREGGKEGTFELLDYQISHKYCLRAKQELRGKRK